MAHLNPFVPPDADEPTVACFSQKFLMGVPQERIDAVAEGMGQFQKLIDGQDYDTEKVTEFYSAMCKDIAMQRKKIGGDWVVAHAVPTRKFRDHFRAKLGPDLLFIVLNMTKEDQMGRIKNRHGDEALMNDMLVKAHDIYEAAAKDEPNTIDVWVTKDMSRDDVVDKILDMVKKY